MDIEEMPLGEWKLYRPQVQTGWRHIGAAYDLTAALTNIDNDGAGLEKITVAVYRGRFWQARSGCEMLLDRAAVLACRIWLR